MANIDSSIYFQQQQPTLPNPLAQAAQLSQLQNSQAQNQLSQMNLQRGIRQDQQEQGLNAALSSAYDPTTGKLDPTKAYSALAAGGQGGAIPGVQKTFAEQAKAAREADKATLESAIQKQSVIAQTASAAKDQASWDSGLQSLSQMGIDVSQIPKQYDPATADMLLKRSLTGVQQLDNNWKQKGYDLDVKKVTETNRHNQAQESTAQGQLGVAQGNLGVSRQRLEFDQSQQPKGQFDSSTGMLIDTRTGVARPVTNPDGTPLPNTGKAPTEFQGKSLAYGSRAAASDKILSDIEGQYSPAQVNSKNALSNTPIIGGALGAMANKAIGPTNQRAEQAQRDFTNAILRQESGAAISPSEFDSAKKQYFPQPGDSPEVIAQKSANRKLVIQGFATNAGNAGKAIMASSSVSSNTNGLPSDINDLVSKYGAK